ncbi:uncharacterized protein LOC111641149 isoform X2 [Centruroides sculpturatus]|uniref:uncharacterized protein LOC111641149 isoform X2 n=1 Tax=Centruroides sculpturatus TaxID=218467 RepID=UPI000C6E283F|nr:uncharacterized protein LOC111641149 isoform X2 [Centruroides sculpturatus]
MCYVEQIAGNIKLLECQIPDVSPYDATIKHLVKVYEKLRCSTRDRLSTYTQGNVLMLDKDNEIVSENISCCYRPFYRPLIAKNDNEIRYYNTCVQFDTSATIREEFIAVECSIGKKVIYKNFHSFIHDKPRVETRCQMIRNVLKKEDFYSVMIIGIDSVSRLNMHRQLSKTLDYLKKKMDGIEMFGYNKVGENTFPNLVPLLSGYHEKELSFCKKNDRGVIDECPSLWKKFKEFGYRTLYAEDTPHISTFNYVKPGFRKQPTDYYFRPFILEAEKHIGWKKSANCHQCVGSISETEAVLSWLESFARQFENRSYFSFAWINSLTHDFLNYGSYGDSYYEEFFQRLHQSEKLKNTVVIFMSDHGMRWGSIRKTYIGRLEERLPILLISFPPSFRLKYPKLVENVRINAYRLTTPFDLFATLNNLLNANESSLDAKYWSVPSRIVSKYVQRAHSLFTPISKNRSCIEASIQEHLCTCQQSRKISVDDKEVVDVADYLLTTINYNLRDYSDCARLVRDEIVSARIRAPTKYLRATKEYDIFDYLVAFKTVPGNGLFEATVRFVPKNHTHVLLGDISRVNMYNNQSSCVQDANIRKYCYCE